MAETENQRYHVVLSEKEFEIRFYPTSMMATVYSDAKTYRELAYPGFRKLAGYIFGSNESETKISMAETGINYPDYRRNNLDKSSESSSECSGNVLLCNDLFHVYTSKLALSWKDIPANSIQKRGEPETDCFNKMCRML